MLFIIGNSGDTRDSFGSMLEIAWRGRDPFLFDEEGKVKRVFLQDGDSVTIRGLYKLHMKNIVIYYIFFF